MHSATQTTPKEAREQANKAEVKGNLEQARVMTRRYPKLVIGSKVGLVHKNDTLDKKRIPAWSDAKYEVVEMNKEHDQTFYKINDNEAKSYTRHEWLKRSCFTVKS